MSPRNNCKRRDVLKRAGAAGGVGIAAGVAGCNQSGGKTTTAGAAFSNFPVTGDTVTFGLNVPQSGPYAAEGEDELRGYKLAIQHLNNGGGWVESQHYANLTGDGVRGKQVEFVTGDTETSADAAEQSAKKMIRDDDVIMFTGGSSSSVAIREQKVAQDERVVFMCCLTHSNDTTGKSCVRYSFREMFNAYMTAQALQPVLTDAFGTDENYYQLWADYTWGKTVQSSIAQFMNEAGWTEVGNESIALGTNNYRTALEKIAKSDANVVFLVQYGLDGANALNQAQEILPDDMEIVVPLYNRLIAENASDAIEGVYGTVAWDTSIDTPLSNTFEQSFRSEYANRAPSGPAQLAYTSTLMYAAAVERAETFQPPDVIEQLEGHVYAAGMGGERMRACDHQSVRPVPVVRGLPKSEQQGSQFYEFVEFTRDVGYSCDEGPAAECSLGSYGTPSGTGGETDG